MISRAVYDLLDTVRSGNLLSNDSDTNLEIFLKGELYEYKTKGADPLVFRTMELAWKIFEQCGSANDTLERLANSLESHGVDWDMLGEELSIERMREIAHYFVKNAEKMNKDLGLKIPAVPFGHKNSTWERMLREYQNGDKFFEYASSSDKSNYKSQYQTGYCLIRGNKVLVTLCTART